MKGSRLLVVAVVALMILAAIPAQVAQGQSAYTEKLSVFVSGSDALWYFTYTGINGSSKLSAFESTPGLSWYNVTAISTAGFLSDMQLFGPRGYGILPVPFIPSQGLFLKLGSDSYADASAAAKSMDSYLLTSFTSYSNGTGTYSFYSPISFAPLVTNTLWKFVPSSAGGFANALSQTVFLGSDSPFIVLEGQKASSGFNHSLVIGSISSTALNGTDQPNLLGYFSGTVTSIHASSESSSSVVQVRFLDGIVVSTDKATVTSNSADFTGSYTLTLAPGNSLYSINATVVEQPAPLLASRAVDTGVLRTDDSIAVTLTLQNLSPSDTITKVLFSDDWWNTTGDFKFLGGNYTVLPTQTISPGGSVTPVYRLQYTGTSTGSLTIPASVVRYQYTVVGNTFNGTAIMNPIRLSLGADDAVVYTNVVPVGGFDQVAGATQKFNVTATNVGTLPASSVVVAGQSIAGLAAKSGSSAGGSATVTVTLTVNGLLGVNQTKAFSTTYLNPSGASLNSTSNTVPTVFSHTSMLIGYPAVAVGAQLASLVSLQTNLTLTFTTTNGGFANVTSFRATGTLPAGLGCGIINGTGLSCSGKVLTLSYPTLNSSATFTTTMKYNLTDAQNYLMAPLRFSGLDATGNITGYSNSVAIPGGLVVSKDFVPAQLFGGMNSQVKVTATNFGPLPVFNVTVGSTVDSFDTFSSAANLTKTVDTIAAGGNTAVFYGVTATQTFGTLNGTAGTASFYFGGSSFTISGAKPSVKVYQPLTATISTYPITPEEGKNFTITFTITNPSGVPVSDVLFTLSVPSGVGLSDLRNAQLSAGVLTMNLGSLSAHGVATATVSAVASSGITIPFSNGKLTFTYSGITINGLVPTSTGIAISEDITTRYLIPTAFVLLVLLFTAFYIRRKVGPTVPASPK